MRGWCSWSRADGEATTSWFLSILCSQAIAPDGLPSPLLSKDPLRPVFSQCAIHTFQTGLGQTFFRSLDNGFAPQKPFPNLDSTRFLPPPCQPLDVPLQCHSAPIPPLECQSQNPAGILGCASQTRTVGSPRPREHVVHLQ